MIKKILIEYKEATINFIKAIDKIDCDSEKYLNIRQEKIESLKKIQVDKSELRNVWEELELQHFENEAMNILKGKKLEINNSIMDIKKSKNAYQAYGNNFKNIYFVNKKI